MKLNFSKGIARTDRKTRKSVERHVRFALTRFAPAIDDAAIVLSDESGPKGAPVRKCRIAVRLRPRGLVVVDALGHDMEAAANLAADKASRSVSRQISRRRVVKRTQRRRAIAKLEEELLAN